MTRLLVAPIVSLLLLSGCPSAECAVDGDCQAGFTCDATGKCVSALPDAGPGGGGGGTCPDNSIPSAPNVLSNPGGECGTTGWFEWEKVGARATLAVESEGAHSGSKALVLTASEAGSGQFGPRVSNLKQVTAAAGETWCAQAWLRGGTAGEARLAILRTPASGGQILWETYSIPLASQWAVNPPSKGLLKVTATETETLELVVMLHNAAAGETLVFDDAQLWKSPGGACSER